LKENLLANDINQAVKLLTRGGKTPGRVDLMLDNAGFELVADLALVDILLDNRLAEQVILHAKWHPTFVSDVIDADLHKTIQHLQSDSHELTVQFGRRLADYFSDGRLRSRAHLFWNSPSPMWEIPDDIRTDLLGSDLLISKGDANYRRLLGDREWDFTVPFHQVVNYLPVPLLALRTLKCELAVGMNLDQIQQVHNQDQDWMINGKWGVIHFAPAAKDPS
jgi:hypothetical protein